MMFILEALAARNTATRCCCTTGRRAKPQLAVIDGGPARRLTPTRCGRGSRRLAGRARSGGRRALPIDLMMVSHIDDDHINGVLDLMRKLATCAGRDSPCRGRSMRLWHNAFDDILATGAVVNGRGRRGRRRGCDGSRCRPACGLAATRARARHRQRRPGPRAARPVRALGLDGQPAVRRASSRTPAGRKRQSSSRTLELTVLGPLAGTSRPCRRTGTRR